MGLKDIFRAALPIIGAVAGFVIGSAFGMPLFGAQIGFAIGAAASFILFPPEGKTVEGPRLDDLTVTFSSYGRPIVRIFGTMETGGNVVWTTGLQEHRIEESEDVGGFFGFFETTVTTVSWLYTASWRILYCVGPVDDILRNWADGKLVRDKTGAGPIDTYIDSKAPGNLVIRDYLGTATQRPGPAEVAAEGADVVNAYRNIAGQEIQDLPLENFGNRIPQWSAEISTNSSDPLGFKRTDPPAGYFTQNVLYDSDGVTAYVYSGRSVNVIDFRVQEVISNFAYTTGDVVHVDSRSRMWASTGNTVRVYLYDAKTGVSLGSWSGNGWSSVNPNGFILLSGEESFVIIGQSGRMMHGRHSLGIISASRNHLSDPAFTLANFFPGFGCGLSPGIFVAYDSNRDAWITITDLVSGLGNLIKFSKITGNPIIRYTFSYGNSSIYYMASQNCMLIRAGSTLRKFSLDTFTITDTLVTNGFTSSGRSESFFKKLTRQGHLYVQRSLTGNGDYYDVESIPMVHLGNFNPRTWVGGVSNIEAPMYDPVNNAVVVTGSSGAESGNYLYLSLGRGDPSEITVRSIVEDISALVGWEAITDIDAVELTDTLPGYIVRSRITARKALEPLATAFNFRSVESDHKVKFIKRGKASVGNIPQIDLGATAGETPTTESMIKTRVPEDQLFETVVIEYVDPTFDNNMNTQQAKRSKEAIDVGGSLKFDFPGALGNNQAAQIVERMLFQAWAGRTDVQIQVPLKHVLLDPGDVITITKDGKTVQIELHDVRLGGNSIIKMRGTIDDSAVHLSTAIGSTADGDEGQVIIINGPTDFFVMDIPLLYDGDESTGLYISAGTPEGVPWTGATIFRGLDSVSTIPFTSILSTTNADYGNASSVLATASPNKWDRVNTVNVRMLSGILTSDTEVNVLNGANRMLIGDEIIQFATATNIGGSSYTLSTLLRGRRGSETFSGTHVVNERVVVLTSENAIRKGVPISAYLETFFYRAVTKGSSLFSGLVEQQLKFRSQMPYAPSHLAGTISADDWTFTLVRRSRLDGQWLNLSGNPALGEVSESYEWDVMDGATVKRTLTSTSPSVLYNSADQNTDFSMNVTTVELNVYQISGDVGRGFVRNVTLVGG